MTARGDDVAVFVRGLTELLARRARVQHEANGAIAIYRTDADDAPALVIETRAVVDLEARLGDLAARGADMVACVPGNCVELRVWDRFAWQFEERDVVDPAECEALGIELSIERDGDCTTLVVESPLTGERAVLARRRDT